MATQLARFLRGAAPAPAKARFLITVRHASADSESSVAHRRYQSSPDCPHVYAKPSVFVRSWKDAPPSVDPAKAQKKLALLRREYAKQVKQLRQQYAYEMELQRQEKIRKDEARREEARVANEERKAAKAAAALAAAAERKVVEEEFRRTLLKERAEKLQSWRTKEELQEKKTSEKKELLRRQSSMWIDESELKKRISDAHIDTKQL